MHAKPSNISPALLSFNQFSTGAGSIPSEELTDRPVRNIDILFYRGNEKLFLLILVYRVIVFQIGILKLPRYEPRLDLGYPELLLYLSEDVHVQREIPLTVEEKAWLEAHPVIRVGSDPNWAPVEFLTADDAFDGIAIDISNIYTNLIFAASGNFIEFAESPGF